MPTIEQTSNPPALTPEALAALCERVDATLDVVGKLIPRGIEDAPRGLAAHGRMIAAAVARLRAQAADAQRDIPLLEARRAELEAAVRAAGETYSGPESKAARQRLQEELGTTQVAIAEARQQLAQLTTP